MSSLRYLSSIIFVVVLLFSSLFAGNMNGVVYNAETGDVVSDAKIIALSYTANGDSLQFSTRSTSDGQYELTNMAPYSYIVWCEHPDYQVNKVNDVVISENANFTLNFSLLRHYEPDFDTRISGVVYSTTELLPAMIPLSGAKVVIYGVNSRFETMSNDDGRYKFNNVPPGEYKLIAEAAHHLPYEHSDIISLQQGDYIDDLNIQLVQLPHPNTSTVYGKIVSPTDNTPVYPAYVTVIPLYYTMIDGPIPVEPDIYAVINNPDGSYVVENIPSGKYLMICSAETYKWQRIENIELVDQKVKVDFFLDELDPTNDNLITGTIYEYPTRGHVLSLVDVYLTYIDPDLERPEILYHSLSDGFGHYQFHNVYNGFVEMRFSKWGFEPLSDSLKVSDDTWLTNQDYWLKPINQIDPIVLKGFVYQADNTGSNKPIYPAHIQMYTINSAGEQIRYNTINNPDGSYQISGIRQGTYTVVCTAVGYEKQVEDNIVLSAPQHELDFYLEPLGINLFGHITGRVHFDKLNQPVAGALISFLPKFTDLTENDAAYHTITGADGHYKMMLPEDEYIISCQYRGPDGWYFYQEYYDDAHTIANATPVKLHGGEIVADINFGIPYPAIVSSVKITGNVSDTDGNALAQAVVNVRPYDMPTRAYGAADNIYQTRTDDQGNYIIEIDLYWITIPTPVLGFIVSAHKDNYITEFYKEKKTPYEADILWAFSDTTFQAIDFTLDPLNQTYAIQGMISSDDGMAIPQAFIIGFHALTGEVAFGVSGNNGDYQLSGLKKGYYFLLFVASGYAPEFYDDARRWEEARPVWVNGVVSDIDASLTPMPTFSGNINGIVSGRIFDESGNPLSGAMVTMQLRDKPIHAYNLSDGDGMFELPWEESGEYLVTISKVNYSSYSAWIKVGSEGAPTTTMLFNLESTFTDLPDDPDKIAHAIPTVHRLYQNYPNPFNPSTNIQFDLPEQEEVNLIIYDILGNRVRELFNESLPAGNHTVTWDGLDQHGVQVSSGLYFYAIQTPDTRMVGRMILQK